MNLIRILKFLRLAALVACVLPSAVMAAHPLFRVTDLGALPGSAPPGYEYSYAKGVNDLGQVTGYSGSSAFYWSPQSGMVELGIPATFDLTSGVAINNSGQIAVRASKQLVK